VTARINLKTSRLDGRSQIAQNLSRRGKARFVKALVRLVNARDTADLRSVVKGFPDLMPPGAGKIDWKAGLNEQDETARSALMQIGLAQSKLRAAWKLPDGAFRKCILIELAGDSVRRYFGSGLTRFVSITGQFEERHFPPSRQYLDAAREMDSVILQAPKFLFVMLAALHAAPEMRVCQKLGCPHPFYLRSEGGKQFCSPACAKPARDNAKLRWWNAHKEELLARRRAERKRRKRASRRKKSVRREKRK